MDVLKDGKPHSFVELLDAVEMAIRPDVAIAKYRQSKMDQTVSVFIQVTKGRQRILQGLIWRQKRLGKITQEGKGLTSMVQLVATEAK